MPVTTVHRSTETQGRLRKTQRQKAASVRFFRGPEAKKRAFAQSAASRPENRGGQAGRQARRNWAAQNCGFDSHIARWPTRTRDTVDKRSCAFDRKTGWDPNRGLLAPRVLEPGWGNPQQFHHCRVVPIHTSLKLVLFANWTGIPRDYPPRYHTCVSRLHCHSFFFSPWQPPRVSPPADERIL